MRTLKTVSTGLSAHVDAAELDSGAAFFGQHLHAAIDGGAQPAHFLMAEEEESRFAMLSGDEPDQYAVQFVRHVVVQHRRDRYRVLPVAHDLSARAWSVVGCWPRRR